MVAKKEKIDKDTLVKDDENLEVFAHIKYLKGSASKFRKVANLIRSKSALQSIAILKALPNRSASVLLKALVSVISNAKNNSGMNETKLVISTLQINEGAKSRRYRARARGRIFPVIKQTAHIKIGVSES